MGEQGLETRKGRRPLPADEASAHLGNLRASVKPTPQVPHRRQGRAAVMSTHPQWPSSVAGGGGGVITLALSPSDLPPGDRVGSINERVGFIFRQRHPGADSRNSEDTGVVHTASGE